MKNIQYDECRTESEAVSVEKPCRNPYRKLESRLLAVQEVVMNVMPQKSEGDEGDVLGIGTTWECFQPEVKIPVLGEEVKINDRGREMEREVGSSIWADIPSGPGKVL